MFSPNLDSDNGNDDDNDDDDEGWITPKNISKLKKKMGFEDDMPSGEEDIKVACLTTDFAMQVIMPFSVPNVYRITSDVVPKVMMDILLIFK